MSNSLNPVHVVGAGLAGCEATWQLVTRGIPVVLHEMRPIRMTKAHKTGNFAELVCSNSLRGAALTNAVGLLKEEMRVLGGLIIGAADACAVPAGGALAVDRDRFSAHVTERVKGHPLVTVSTEEVTSIPKERPCIIATGPLTSPSLAADLQQFVGSDNLAFFDAISPIILGESLDLNKIFRQSRYDKGDSDDYLNVPLSKDEYYAFIELVKAGEKFGGHDEVESDRVDNLRPFEGCMPIEEMVARGPDTLRFGPMKPTGLTDPHTGRRPYAVMQLRQDNREGTLWSMVGFQTKLRHPEQLRIFKTLPGLENAEFVRLGSLHRNTFIDSPKCLNPTLETRKERMLFFAGQITGVEGYVESSATGILAGVNVARALTGSPMVVPDPRTALGGLVHYISDPERKAFQPMNISFGLIGGYGEVGGSKRRGGKDAWRLEVSRRALELTAQTMMPTSAAPVATPSQV
jgi:methylenetetrahydrofolate--tRNA-(uracil-5-)-methyltransferase